MEQMTSGNFLANAFYFSLGILVYNTAQAQKCLFFLLRGRVAYKRQAAHTDSYVFVLVFSF